MACHFKHTAGRRLWIVDIVHFNTDLFEHLQMTVHARDKQTARIKAFRECGIQRELIRSLKLTPVT